MEDLVISLGTNIVSFNGSEIKHSITESKLVKAIGEPDREANFRNGYLLYNGTYIYDRYGMTISFNHGEGSYMTLYYSLKPSMLYRPEIIPCNIFHGTLMINGMELPKADQQENRVLKDYSTKLKESIGDLNNLKNSIDKESYYLTLGGTRVHFQFDNKTKIQATFLSFESNRKRRKNNR